MRTLTIQYPDSLPATANESRERFEREARLAMAVKLFELGRLTSGQAASVAGTTRVRFLLECPRLGTPSVTWDDDELEREFGAPA
jgi:predicted HTH domain antitoxin